MFGLVVHSILLGIGLVAMVPIRLGELGPHPNPAASYDSAVERVREWQEREDTVVALGGRSILLTHGRRTARVVVLFHGLTDSPLQFQAIAQQMFDQGDNVFVPRFPWHAQRDGNVRVIAKLTAQSLRDLGDAAVDVASQLGDTVIVAGLSAGGTVAAWAGQYRREVDRVVLIAPALTVSRVPSAVRGAVLRIGLRAPNITRSEPRDTASPDRVPGWTTHALGQTLLLGENVRAASATFAPRAQQLYLLLNERDHTVSNASAIELARRWGDRGVAVRVYELPDSLRLPHDVIDPRQPRADTAIVYPVLTALLSGTPPPIGQRGRERENPRESGQNATAKR